MRAKSFWLLPIFLFLAGLFLVGYYLFQPVTLIVNGTPLTIRTTSLTVDAILRSAGLPVYAGDIISPPRSDFLLDDQPIFIESGSNVVLWLDGQRIAAHSNDKFPANLLTKYGVKVFPGDILTVDGKRSSPSEKFQLDRYHTVQYRNWRSDDDLPVTPTAKFDETIGIKLAVEGNALLGLDYSIPPENQLPSAETIQVQRVSDKILLEQKALPFESQTIMDDHVELDQTTETQAGEYGLAVNLTRIRSINGTETSRKTISTTMIRPPVNQVMSVGSKVTVKQMDVGGTTIEYWRVVSAYATSYSPCRLGNGTCSNSTASGVPVKKGIIAVASYWYPYMRGQQVYIPGYGFATIADLGGGIPGKAWVDLGYSDDDYIGWASWVTVYFLTPVPSNILYNLN